MSRRLIYGQTNCKIMIFIHKIVFMVRTYTVFYIKIEVKEVHQTFHMKKGLLPNLFSS